MQKVFRIFGFAVICWATVLGSAKALPTALELGTVNPGSPASPALETARLTILVNGYNTGRSGVLSNSFTGDSGHTYTVSPAAGIPAAPLPAVGTNNGQNMGGGGVSTGLQIDLGAGGYTYVMVKWGDASEYYYIGGDTGMIIINNDVNGLGESHYDLFGTPAVASVPDNSSTLALLGFALISLVVAARKFQPATVRVRG